MYNSAQAERQQRDEQVRESINEKLIQTGEKDRLVIISASL